MSILEIQSIRSKNIHIDPLSGERNEFSSINKAKAHSRKLGGAGKVRALSSDLVKVFRKEYLTLHWTEIVKEKEVNLKQKVREFDEAKEAYEKTPTDDNKTSQNLAGNAMAYATIALNEAQTELNKAKGLQA